MSDFVAAAPGDPTKSGYIRTTFEESIVAGLMHGLESRTGDTKYFEAALNSMLASVKADPSSAVTPVSGIEISSGDRAAAVSFKMYQRQGVTFADVARKLNAFNGLTVNTVEWLGTTPDTAAQRALTVATKNKQIADESPLDTLLRYVKNAGIVVLVILALISGLLIYRGYKELPV